MKRTMKKAMSILAASAVLALTLAGCGNESTDPATTDGSGTDSASTVSGTVATMGSTSMEKVIGNLKEQFENDNDGNVTVSYDATVPARALKLWSTAPRISACPPGR